MGILPYLYPYGSSVETSKKGNYGNFGNFGSDSSESPVTSKNLVISESSKISITCTFGKFCNL